MATFITIVAILIWRRHKRRLFNNYNDVYENDRLENSVTFDDGPRLTKLPVFNKITSDAATLDRGSRPALPLPQSEATPASAATEQTADVTSTAAPTELSAMTSTAVPTEQVPVTPTAVEVQTAAVMSTAASTEITTVTSTAAPTQTTAAVSTAAPTQIAAVTSTVAPALITAVVTSTAAPVKPFHRSSPPAVI